VQDEPSRLLGDLEILGQGRAGDPLLWLVISQMAADHWRSGSLVSSKIVPTLIEKR